MSPAPCVCVLVVLVCASVAVGSAVRPQVSYASSSSSSSLSTSSSSSSSSSSSGSDRVANPDLADTVVRSSPAAVGDVLLADSSSSTAPAWAGSPCTGYTITSADKLLNCSSADDVALSCAESGIVAAPFLTQAKSIYIQPCVLKTVFLPVLASVSDSVPGMEDSVSFWIESSTVTTVFLFALNQLEYGLVFDFVQPPSLFYAPYLENTGPAAFFFNTTHPGFAPKPGHSGSCDVSCDTKATLNTTQVSVLHCCEHAGMLTYNQPDVGKDIIELEAAFGYCTVHSLESLTIANNSDVEYYDYACDSLTQLGNLMASPVSLKLENARIDLYLINVTAIAGTIYTVNSTFNLDFTALKSMHGMRAFTKAPAADAKILLPAPPDYQHFIPCTLNDTGVFAPITFSC